MSHRYSLRPNVKGRRGHQSANEPEGRVEGTSQSTSTDGILASKGGHGILTGEPENELGTVESRPTISYPSRAAHNTPACTQDPEEDWQRATRYRVQGPAETSEEIQAARKRVEARRIAEAGRIRRVQIVRGYEEDLHALRARIEALRRECEVRVNRVQRKSERDWAIKWGEMEEEENEMNKNREDVDSEMAVDNYAPTETSLTSDDDEDRQLQGPSRFASSRPPPPQPTSRQSPNLYPYRCGRSSHHRWEYSNRPSSRRLESNEMEEEVERGPEISSSNSQFHPSPLRRQPAQLMVVPTI